MSIQLWKNQLMVVMTEQQSSTQVLVASIQITDNSPVLKYLLLSRLQITYRVKCKVLQNDKSLIKRQKRDKKKSEYITKTIQTSYNTNTALSMTGVTNLNIPVQSDYSQTSIYSGSDRQSDSLIGNMNMTCVGFLIFFHYL